MLSLSLIREHGNEPSDSMKDDEFLDQLSESVSQGGQCSMELAVIIGIIIIIIIIIIIQSQYLYYIGIHRVACLTFCNLST
jgi:hypothetical protein